MGRKKILKFTLKCECVVSVIVKRPVLPPCVVDGRSRNPLYYYYYCSILPGKNNGVIAPYTQWPVGDAPCQEFDENGKHIATHSKVTGKQTLLWFNASGFMSLDVKKIMFHIVDKSQKRTSHSLVSSLLGISYIRTRKVTSEDPHEREEIHNFRILHILFVDSILVLTNYPLTL